ncbi:translation initiation factor IF-2-like [Homo sapiens]|uniref:translation initiation factor IF-2-like n=1 Tax=Homo sapiens TaxID=9606 RepID=UPI001FB0C1BD|nr:translation initiation factor IF-2-like [Homo sapiens]
MIDAKDDKLLVYQNQPADAKTGSPGRLPGGGGPQLDRRRPGGAGGGGGGGEGEGGWRSGESVKRRTRPGPGPFQAGGPNGSTQPATPPSWGRRVPLQAGVGRVWPSGGPGQQDWESRGLLPVPCSRQTRVSRALSFTRGGRPPMPSLCEATAPRSAGVTAPRRARSLQGAPAAGWTLPGGTTAGPAPPIPRHAPTSAGTVASSPAASPPAPGHPPAASPGSAPAAESACCNLLYEEHL